MISLSPVTPLFICHEAVNFRLGIDGLIGFCKHVLKRDPQTGAYFVFKNRGSTSIRLLFYVEDGWWLCTKRFSQGKIKSWPQREDDQPLSPFTAREMNILLSNGDPQGANFPAFWKRIDKKTREGA